MCIDRTLDAPAPSVAGGVARLDTVGIGDALDTQSELGVAAALSLAGAVARFRAALRAAVQGVVAALIRAAIGGDAAFDADATDTRGFGGTAAFVHATLDTGSAGTHRAVARTVARLVALDGHARELRKQLERTPLVEVARERDGPEHDTDTGQSEQRATRSRHGEAVEE
jgi:hypothetical protein